MVRGSSTFVSLSSSDPDVAIIRPDTFQHVALDVPHSARSDDAISRPGAYPRSLMGVIAVVRQTFFDAQFQAADLAHFAAHPQNRPRPAFATALEALQAAITLIPAQLHGVGDTLGSIEAGKDASIFAATGDILDIRAEVKHLWISGVAQSLETRHTRLAEKYRARPKAK